MNIFLQGINVLLFKITAKIGDMKVGEYRAIRYQATQYFMRATALE